MLLFSDLSIILDCVYLEAQYLKLDNKKLLRKNSHTSLVLFLVQKVNRRIKAEIKENEKTSFELNSLQSYIQVHM